MTKEVLQMKSRARTLSGKMIPEMGPMATRKYAEEQIANTTFMDCHPDGYKLHHLWKEVIRLTEEWENKS